MQMCPFLRRSVKSLEGLYHRFQLITKDTVIKKKNIYRAKQTYRGHESEEVLRSLQIIFPLLRLLLQYSPVLYHHRLLLGDLIRITTGIGLLQTR